MNQDDCQLCLKDGGELIWQDRKLRVIHAQEPGFPAFYRVIWNQHITEFSDLSPADRVYCMEVVDKVELVLRKVLAPTKVNLASLGNVVPHLHWHVIARFNWDSRFPSPVWSQPEREDDALNLKNVSSLLPKIKAEIIKKLD